MKVKDLLSALLYEDSDAEVFFEYPSGDYWRTRLAGSVDMVETATVEWSEYHREWSLPRDDDKQLEDMEQPKRVVLLR